jgi:hypothetical protein
MNAEPDHFQSPAILGFFKAGNAVGREYQVHIKGAGLDLHEVLVLDNLRLQNRRNVKADVT